MEPEPNSQLYSSLAMTWSFHLLLFICCTPFSLASTPFLAWMTSKVHKNIFFFCPTEVNSYITGEDKDNKWMERWIKYFTMFRLGKEDEELLLKGVCPLEIA